MQLRMWGVTLLAMQALACKDAAAPSESSSTSIIITIKLAGVYPFDAFGIRIDDRMMNVLKNEPGLVVTGLTPGTHTVALAQLPANCHNDGPAQLTVETTSANLSTADFSVSCIANAGKIGIAVSVSGYARPLVMTSEVDGTITSYYVRPNFPSVFYNSYDAGAHIVRLSQIPTFCEPSGAMSTSVTVKTGAVKQDTAIARFDIKCGAPPPLGVDTAASIAFERDGYVMTIRESGGNPVALAPGATPSWSRDGKLIAFERTMSCDEFGCDRDLWLTTSSGQDMKTILPSEYTDDYDAALSPDSRKIAFMRFFPGPDMSYLAVANLNGDSLKYVSVWSPVNSPTWSPDGSQLVFSCWRNSQSDLCVVSPEKRCFLFEDRCDLSEDHLTTLPGDEQDPAWSPDGKRIAFTVACGGSPTVCPSGVTQTGPAIAVVDVITRQVTLLKPGHDPAWSPDSSQLVFTGNAGTPGLRVYKFTDGSVRQLTTGPADKAPSWR